MKPERLKEYLELMKEFGVAELELKDESNRLSLRMLGASVSPAPVAAAPPAPVALAAPAQAPTQAAPATDAPAGEVIKSPMVGTFYRSPKPGAPSFVDVGKSVSMGAVVCIIEAMKLMNEIESEVSGTVLEVLVEDGQAVQFGQPLFRVG